MNNYYVYVLRDPRKDNEPFYVGKGRGDRSRHHFTKTHVKEENRHKAIRIEAIQKAGLEVVVERYQEGLTSEAAYALEADLIQKWGRKGYDPDGILTNVCVDHRPPDHTGRKRSDETRRKMSEKAKGRQKSPEHIENWLKSMEGKRGGPHSEERVAKIRAGNVNSDSPRKKVTWDDVREIRMLSRLGEARREIAAKFPQVSRGTIDDIIAERTWKEEFRPRK